MNIHLARWYANEVIFERYGIKIDELGVEMGIIVKESLSRIKDSENVSEESYKAVVWEVLDGIKIKGGDEKCCGMKP